MALHIRDPRAAELARKLAAKRGQTMTEAVIAALESELRRHGKRRSLGQRLDEIAEELADKGNPAIARLVSEEEIDVLWGNG
jgi:antitoxin VapB